MVILQNGDQTLNVDVPHGVDAGHIRTLREELDEIGAPSSFTIAVNGVGVEDSSLLPPGAVVTLRPKAGEKG